MFIQVFQGRLADAEGVRRQMELWRDELAPQAKGWLGSTAGTTPDGTFVGIARFESEEAARANSDRPEQGEWWAETEKCFDGAPAFKDYTNVDTFIKGGSDDAGFVQVIQGRAKDVETFKQGIRAADDDLSERRPDVIGGVAGWCDDGDFTQAVYFSSEAEARRGEQGANEGEAAESMRTWLANLEDVTYHDLTQPQMFSP